jgi:protein-L-isoaspartate(D-aspartate) O-methyltransferase
MMQATIMDGRQVESFDISFSIRGEKIRSGEGSDKAALMVQFFDADRNAMHPVEVIGPWEGTFNWREVKRTLNVPPKSREAICRVGLNGATGQLSVDNVRITAQPKISAKSASKAQPK